MDSPTIEAQVDRVWVLFGTRPEAIKLAPVVAALRRRPDRFAVRVCAAAQHREMGDRAAAALALAPDLDLDLMRPGQAPSELAARALAALDPLLRDEAPDWLVVQGDTTTALAGALAAFHRGIRLAHVEAGLRTGDLGRPFPEEMNRRVVDLVASAHFAPTRRAVDSLRREGVAADRIHLTGNTVVDALQDIAARLPPRSPGPVRALVTLHRRESFGAPLAGILGALRRLASEQPAIRWIFPVHPNPAVHEPAHRLLAGLPNLELRAPLDYAELVGELRAARLAITDSGGIQEEAPTFGTPVVVVREVTERPEGVEAGLAVLAGTDPERIVAEATRLLAAPRPSPGRNPYGDGRAAGRIVAALAGEPFEPFAG